MTLSLRVAALIVAIAAAAPAAAPAGESQAASVRMYFLQGEQLIAVTRPGSTVKAAVTALLAGPLVLRRGSSSAHTSRPAPGSGRSASRAASPPST